MKQIGVKNVKLTEYEMSIAAHLVDPLSMHVSLSLSVFLSPPLIHLGGSKVLTFGNGTFRCYCSREDCTFNK